MQHCHDTLLIDLDNHSQYLAKDLVLENHKPLYPLNTYCVLPELQKFHHRISLLLFLQERNYSNLK